MNASEQAVADPHARVVGEEDEGNEEGQEPDLGEGGEDSALVDALGDVRDQEELADEEDLSRDGEEVEDGEAKLAEDEGHVGVDGGRRQVGH